MRDYIDAIAVIRNEKSFDNDKCEVVRFDPEERQRIFDAFKTFVADSAKGYKRRRIIGAKFEDVNDWGILRRLVYYPKNDEVHYICGQNWDSEMITIRDAFDPKVPTKKR